MLKASMILFVGLYALFGSLMVTNQRNFSGNLVAIEPKSDALEHPITIPEWQKEMEQTIPEWQKECGFEEDFIFPLYKTSRNKQNDAVNITLVSSFYNQHETGMQAVRLNMRDNLHHGRFIYILGDSKKDLNLLKSIAPLSEINMEVWYAPGGVTYRHLFAAATKYPETFVIHNSDIGVGNMTILLDACFDIEKVALVGSRVNFYPDPDYPSNCTGMMNRLSFDAIVTTPKNIGCKILNALDFKPHFWGAENRMAGLVMRADKIMLNLCPRWRFTHYHHAVKRKRSPKPRINIPIEEGTFFGSSYYGTFRNDVQLAWHCDHTKLPPFEEIIGEVGQGQG